MANDIKRQPAATVTVDGTRLTFAFANGAVHEYDVAELPPDLIMRAAVHGVEQKLRDAYALGIEEVNGRMVRPTIDAKVMAFGAVAERLFVAHQWNAPRGDGEPTGGMLYRACKAVMPTSPFTADAATFKAWIEEQATKRGTTKRVVEDGLRKNARVQAEIDRMRAARGADTIDSDELLRDMEA